MRPLRPLLRDEAGTAAEFALVLPVALLFLFGIIDGGRFVWEVNQAEKATQMGARFAVVTDMVAADLGAWSFAEDGGIVQGTVVQPDDFVRITCRSADGAVTCECPAGAPCDFGETADPLAFGRIVDRMQAIMPTITDDNVVVSYSWSGLGFSGDPNGPDVAPLTTVSLEDMTFAPLTLIAFGATVGLPGAHYSLTLEDGQGEESY